MTDNIKQDETGSDWALTERQARKLAWGLVAATLEGDPDEWLNVQLRERGCPEAELAAWREYIENMSLEDDDEDEDSDDEDEE